MQIDLLVAEIGSTTTIVNAFQGMNSSDPSFIGQGFAPTTVGDGDVNIGLQKAIANLSAFLKTDRLHWDKMLGTSSAAGGLKMTVHGLVYDMTAKAAREAALGAGAILHMVTAGSLRRTDLEKIKHIGPNIILIAGGLDYGERDTALDNAEKITALGLRTPIIYAGNCENAEEIKLIFANYHAKSYICENVYPKVDVLNVEPTRKVIQDVFEEHIIEAPGMSNIRELINGHLMPVPASVMEAAKLLKEEIGDLMVFDIGGATSDVHSVCTDSDEIAKILLSPEPEAKRTVEGDLGLFVNLHNVIELVGLEKISAQLDFDPLPVLHSLQAIPKTEQEIKFLECICLEIAKIALNRHAGKKRFLYGTQGRKSFAEGKDLSRVKYLIGTGGALTRLPQGKSILRQILSENSTLFLYPDPNTTILIDNQYIMSSLGVMSLDYPEAANKLLKKSLGI
jgi:uncharacterized protein (TIGR01319 family)